MKGLRSSEFTIAEVARRGFNRGMLTTEDFRPSGDRPGVFLSPGPMKKYFAEYERWMLEHKNAKDEDRKPHFRDLLKAEVEHLAAALRDNQPFAPYRFDQESEGPECNTSSVTI